MSVRKVAGKPTYKNAIKAFDSLMAREGGVKAIMIDGRIQLYSGPLAFITKLLRAKNNRYKAMSLPKDEAGLVDYTKVGGKALRYAAGKDIYAYFEHYYGEGTEEAFFHADTAMRYASRLFSQNCSGHIETHVCGAGFDKVFFEVELPELLNNKKVETINDIPLQRIKDIYMTQGAAIAYREVCKGEIELARKRAAKECTAEAKKDLQDRISFFRIGNMHHFAMMKFKREEVVPRMGANHVRIIRNDPIRPMKIDPSYKAKAIQYG